MSSGAAPIGPYLEDGDDRLQSFRLLFLAPTLFALVTIAAPVYAPLWAVVGGVGIALAVAAELVFFRRKGYRSRIGAGAFGTFQVDLMCLFATLLAWRVVRGPAWLLAVFLVALVAVAALAYLCREAVLQELTEPRTFLGRWLLVVLAGSTAAGGGALGFAYGRTTGGGWAVSVPLLAVSLYLVLWRQSLWLRVERPDWEPRRRPASARHS